MKPFIDECGIIHIAYMTKALFYQRKWLPLVLGHGRHDKKTSDDSNRAWPQISSSSAIGSPMTISTNHSG